MKINNRRRFHRINFDEQVALEFGDDTYDNCRVKNISLGGMFVSGKLMQEETENCQVSLYHDKNTGKPRIKALATVVWGNEKGVGLKFTAMTHENYMQLLTTLINNSKKPAVILHEFPKNCPFEIKDI